MKLKKKRTITSQAHLLPTILFILAFRIVNADCSDLSYEECLTWSDFCEWNEETELCQEIGGGGGDNIEYGPYQFTSINESNGLRNGPDYADGVLYYPTDAEPPYKSVVLTPGHGGGSSSMAMWGEFYASHGFISMTIGPNDEIDDTWEQRAYGLLDAITTVKEEHWRTASPVVGLIDTSRFIVSGYSMGGGASQIALTIEDSVISQSIVAGIALNPFISLYDCDNCPPESAEGCWCFLPEHMIHDTPTLIIAGQNEIDEFPVYEGAMGQDIYAYTPESTIKMLYEIESGGHGSAEIPYGDVLEKSLFWAKYHLNEDFSYCDSLMTFPENASQFITTLGCGSLPLYDLNGDGETNQADLTMLVLSILNQIDFEDVIDFNFDQYTDIYDILILSDIIN